MFFIREDTFTFENKQTSQVCMSGVSFVSYAPYEEGGKNEAGQGSCLLWSLGSVRDSSSLKPLLELLVSLLRQGWLHPQETHFSFRFSLVTGLE